MEGIRTPDQEAAEDVFFGQSVIIWARWIVILAGAILVLSTTDESDELALSIIPIVVLMVVNFYLHGRYMMERPVNQAMIVLTSLIDVVVISLIVIFWLELRGLGSPFFVLYYPLILGFAFVMPRGLTFAFTMAALAAYVTAVILGDLLFPRFVTLADDVVVRTWVFSSEGAEQVILRLITLGAMGGLGSFYWRIQRERRREAAGGSPATPERQVATATGGAGPRR